METIIIIWVFAQFFIAGYIRQWVKNQGGELDELLEDDEKHKNSSCILAGITTMLFPISLLISID